jgi:hypothetical protein
MLRGKNHKPGPGVSRSVAVCQSSHQLRCSGSRCDSGVVLATVTGESSSTKPLASRRWEGGGRAVIRKPGDRPRR